MMNSAPDLDEMFGVTDILSDLRYQLEVRDAVLLQIRSLLGPDGHRVTMASLPKLLSERLKA